MNKETKSIPMPPDVARMMECGYVCWANDRVTIGLRQRFDPERIPVDGVRHVRVWGVQVDDERELPGHERTQIPDEEIWELSLRARDGSHFAVDSSMLRCVD